MISERYRNTQVTYSSGSNGQVTGEEIKYPSFTLPIHYESARSYKEEGKLKLALSSYRVILELEESFTYGAPTFSKAMLLQEIGDLYKLLKDYKLAVTYFESSIHMLEELPNIMSTPSKDTLINQLQLQISNALTPEMDIQAEDTTLSGEHSKSSET